MTSKLQEPLFTRYALGEMSVEESKRYIETLIKEGVAPELILSKSTAIKETASQLRKEFFKESPRYFLNDNQKRKLKRNSVTVQSFVTYSMTGVLLCLFVMTFFGKGVSGRLMHTVDKSFGTVDANVKNLTTDNTCFNQATNFPECTRCKEGYSYNAKDKTCMKR